MRADADWRVVGAPRAGVFDVTASCSNEDALDSAGELTSSDAASNRGGAQTSWLVSYITLASSIFSAFLRAVERPLEQPTQSLAPYGCRLEHSNRARPAKTPVQHLQPDARRRRSSMARLLPLIAAAYALDRPTSRFQNAFGNRGSSVRRKRTLPVYRPPDSPATPLPVPGSSRTLRYQPEGAANAQLVRDLQQYGALVVIIGDGEDEPIGCVVDVRLAEVLNGVRASSRVDGRLLERRCGVASFSNLHAVTASLAGLRRGPGRGRGFLYLGERARLTR